jgi:hypothetical protein
LIASTILAIGVTAVTMRALIRRSHADGAADGASHTPGDAPHGSAP